MKGYMPNAISGKFITGHLNFTNLQEGWNSYARWMAFLVHSRKGGNKYRSGDLSIYAVDSTVDLRPISEDGASTRSP